MILHVTLTFGRRCLVAAANDEGSGFSPWKVVPNGAAYLSVKVYLDTPATDGKIDCSVGAIRRAITIGSVKIYILLWIRHLGNNIVRFRGSCSETQCIARAALERASEGFTVRKGNDAYPSRYSQIGQQDVDVFLMHEDGFLGVLLPPHDGFMNGPASILPPLCSYGMQTTLDSRTWPGA